MGFAEILSESDLAQLEGRGISPLKLAEQLAIFKKGPRHLRLSRPCTLKDGIEPMPRERAEELAAKYEDMPAGLIPAKFVPASGAATRMFKALLAREEQIGEKGPGALEHLRGQKDAESAAAARFLENIEKFPFYARLCAAMKKSGADPEKLIAGGEYGAVLSFALHGQGLDLAHQPKGLIEFHCYGDNCRTPVEEHMVEAADYAASRDRESRICFTVPENAIRNFSDLAEEAAERVSREFGVGFAIDFSVQDPATDTVAATPEGKPFRNADGSLLLRPGGHGALIGNLDRIRADLIFINNIDNVVPDRLKPVRNLYKKALAGLLLETREKISAFLSELGGNPAQERLAEMKSFCRDVLRLDLGDLRGPELVEGMAKLLDRPLRVCGMVRNLGDPGGAPFFVKGEDGTESLQIVEEAQVDPDSEEQKKIFASSTHFNPVDVVIAPFDARGKKYDLTRHVDGSAVFISKKSKDGRDLLALELPGLWNGAMSDWNTVFVEVPMEAYDPVKTVNDLLKESHAA